jgi:hypothetical protein
LLLWGGARFSPRDPREPTPPGARQKRFERRPAAPTVGASA